MAFSGKDPVRSKVCINNKTLEQVITFNYLGCILVLWMWETYALKNIKIYKNNQSHKSNFQTLIGTTTYKIKHLQDSSKTTTNIWKWSLDN
jgi:hypothetical protein